MMDFFILNKNEFSRLIKQKATQLGFTACGIAKSGFLEEDAPRLENWLSNNLHGEMKYMENHFDKRLNPSLLVENAKSVISLSYNYYYDKKQIADAPKISKYAFGEDYHHVVKDKLKILYAYMQEIYGEFHGRLFVDSAPVMERSWAQKSGIGWIGKHSLLIQKARGSFFFLAEIICDLELEYDEPFHTDHCGNCTACIDACPTEAIIADKVVDASKCISYFTIELKGDLPTTFQDKFEDWMFGCDICQDVCPWNRFAIQHQEGKFDPKELLLKMNRKEWTELKEETFNLLFQKSAVKRTKYLGLKRNIDYVNKAYLR